MQKRYYDRNQYFNELAYSSETYFLPFIKKRKEIDARSKVLEIGCGEGGNLLPFAKIGCEVTGIDMANIRVEQAKIFFNNENMCGHFVAGNFFTIDLPARFDLIIIHDVIEHVGDKRNFMMKAYSLLNPGGIIYVGFPPWQMPFGGHQQIAGNKIIARFPFIHLLSARLYRKLLSLAKESQTTIDELTDIKRCGTSVEKFKDTIKGIDVELQDECFYLINPHYEIKFGLKPRKLHAVFTKIPHLRNFFTSSYFCLLSQKTPNNINE